MKSLREECRSRGWAGYTRPRTRAALKSFMRYQRAREQKAAVLVIQRWAREWLRDHLPTQVMNTEDPFTMEVPERPVHIRKGRYVWLFEAGMLLKQICMGELRNPLTRRLLTEYEVTRVQRAVFDNPLPHIDDTKYMFELAGVPWRVTAHTTLNELAPVIARDARMRADAAQNRLEAGRMLTQDVERAFQLAVVDTSYAGQLAGALHRLGESDLHGAEATVQRVFGLLLDLGEHAWAAGEWAAPQCAMLRTILFSCMPYLLSAPHLIEKAHVLLSVLRR